MEVHTPSYYPDFHCLAGACPHTCCAWWEVPVDEETAGFYRTVPGALGQRLRTALCDDGEGGLCFRLTGGKCPFLDEEGLCSLQLQWGEDKIPFICRQHPRFSYDYGGVREVGLCASCPECARLILEKDFTLTSSPLPAEEEEEADELLLPLLRVRAAALALLERPDPLSARLKALLLFGDAVQGALDAGDADALDAVCDDLTGALPAPEGVLPPRGESLGRVLKVLKGLEHLRPEWGAMLDAALACPQALPVPPEKEGGRSAAYFLYRHLLRGLNDADVLSWFELAVLGTAAAGALAALVEGGFPEAFRLFCLETEHSQDNLDALQDALWQELELSELLALA